MAAPRETAIVFAMGIGMLFFKERLNRLHLLSALLIYASAVVIRLVSPYLGRQR